MKSGKITFSQLIEKKKEDEISFLIRTRSCTLHMCVCRYTCLSAPADIHVKNIMMNSKTHFLSAADG